MRKKEKKKNLGFPQKLLALAMVWWKEFGTKNCTLFYHGLLARVLCRTRGTRTLESC
jgi:hypothetical protein